MIYIYKPQPCPRPSMPNSQSKDYHDDEETRGRFNAMVYIMRRIVSMPMMPQGDNKLNFIQRDHALTHDVLMRQYISLARALEAVMQNLMFEQNSLELEVHVLRELLQKAQIDVGSFCADNLPQQLEVLREVAEGCGVRASADEKHSGGDFVAQNIRADVSEIMKQHGRSQFGRIISIRQMLADTYVNSPESARSSVLNILAFALDDANDTDSLLAQLETIGA